MDKLVIIAVALIAVVGASVLILPQLMQPAAQNYDNSSYTAAQDTELTNSVDSEWSNDSDYVEIGEMI